MSPCVCKCVCADTFSFSESYFANVGGPPADEQFELVIRSVSPVRAKPRGEFLAGSSFWLSCKDLVGKLGFSSKTLVEGLRLKVFNGLGAEGLKRMRHLKLSNQ